MKTRIPSTKDIEELAWQVLQNKLYGKDFEFTEENEYAFGRMIDVIILQQNTRIRRLNPQLKIKYNET